MNWKENLEHQKRTIEALVLGYKEPIMYNYKIPSDTILRNSLGVAVKQLSEEKEHPLKDDADFSLRFGGRKEFWEHIELNNVLEKRIIEGIKTSFEARRDEDSFFDTFIGMQNEIFMKEWFYRYGTLYDFRPGQQAKAQQRFNSYWNQKEKSHFADLAKKMRYLSKSYYKKVKEE